MGHQILIIAITGTHNPALPAEITQQLVKQGLQIRHACLTYEGRTSFAVGTPDDLARDLTEAGHPSGICIANAGDAKESITLETVLTEVREHRAEFKKFAVHEKKAAKPPRGKKEEGGAKEDAEPGNDTPPSTGTEAPAPTPEPQEPGAHGEPDAPTTPEP